MQSAGRIHLPCYLIVAKQVKQQSEMESELPASEEINRKTSGIRCVNKWPLVWLLFLFLRIPFAAVSLLRRQTPHVIRYRQRALRSTIPSPERCRCWKTSVRCCLHISEQLPLAKLPRRVGAASKILFEAFRWTFPSLEIFSLRISLSKKTSEQRNCKNEIFDVFDLQVIRSSISVTLL